MTRLGTESAFEVLARARLLAEAGVAALSGTAFGRHGEGFLRFSYANSVEKSGLPWSRSGPS